MSERILKFLLEELRVVRLRCKNQQCRTRGTVEIPLDRLDRLEGFKCPLCGEGFGPDGEKCEDYLAMLAQAVKGLSDKRNKLDVEFILPLKDSPTRP